LAREYKRLHVNCHYLGVELMPEYAKLARRHCDTVLELDIEAADDELFRTELVGDCWVFGDTLEHLRDPWHVLSRIRKSLPGDGCIVACIPNAQHWSVQARLNSGAFRYEQAGLLDRSHLRWFTRLTIVEMFHAAGFRIADGRSRVFDEPAREKVLPAIRMMAERSGADPQTAMNDAMPLQYVVRAVPV